MLGVLGCWFLGVLQAATKTDASLEMGLLTDKEDAHLQSQIKAKLLSLLLNLRLKSSADGRVSRNICSTISRSLAKQQNSLLDFRHYLYPTVLENLSVKVI